MKNTAIAGSRPERHIKAVYLPKGPKRPHTEMLGTQARFAFHPKQQSILIGFYRSGKRGSENSYFRVSPEEPGDSPPFMEVRRA